MRVGLVTIIDTRPFLLMNYKTVSHANLITIYWWRTDIASDNINQKGSCKICFFSSPSLLSATRPPIDTELYLFMWVLIGGRLQRKYDISNRQKLTMNEWASSWVLFIFGSPYLLHGSHITRKTIWFSQLFFGAVQREFLRSYWGGEKRVTLIASPDFLSSLSRLPGAWRFFP